MALMRGLSKTMLWLALPALAASAGAASSAYLEQLVTTGPVMGQPGQTSTQKIWIAPGKFRIEDPGSSTVTILRLDSGKMYLVNPAEKSYSEIPMAQVKAMSEMGMAMMAGKDQGEARATVRETGETEKVGAWQARKVVLEITGPMKNQTTLWLSKDIDLDMSAWAELAQGLALRGAVGDAMDQLKGLEGYPVKQVSKVEMMGMTIDSTQELKVFKPGAVEAALFEPPEGFRKEEAPFPAAMGAGAAK